MLSILLWSRRLLLAALGFVSLISLVGAGVSGHWLGSLAWGFSLLLILVLSAVLFGERFVANPASVAASIVSHISDAADAFANYGAWNRETLQDVAENKIPAETYKAPFLAHAEKVFDAAAAQGKKVAAEEAAEEGV